MGNARPAALIDRLGYQDLPEALHRVDGAVDAAHPYAAELTTVLTTAHRETVLGVYDVAGVPAVCLIAGEPDASPDSYAQLRAQLWNQGLISLLLVIGKNNVQAWPVVPELPPAPSMPVEELDRGSVYSAYGARSGALQALHPEWFDPKLRVDKVLLRNLTAAVDKLASGTGAESRRDAQYLMAQVLFVSYLEARDLITPEFRSEKGLSSFASLLAERNRSGLDHLFVELKERFNGDFLAPSAHTLSWKTLSDDGFDILDRFLQREDLRDGQRSFWRYDFRFIPVELLSSLYESFLAERQKKDGAYYTPRHLANLAVDEAFRGIARPDLEVVWDGACGSGILLTTAFRRMLGVAEGQQGRRLSLAERSQLLRDHIFGGDINSAACKIAAFSLYLCLLEDLRTPPKTKLPELLGKNIFDSEHNGDFFSAQHPVVAGRVPRPTIMLSNPPWQEPEGAEAVKTYELWSATRPKPARIPLRQFATAFAYRATDLVQPGGRLCLIMPAGAFVRPQHRKFLEDWLEQVRLTRLINLSDLRLLLFPGSKHPCMVVTAQSNASVDPMGPPHTFDYVTPKADLGLLYNRLTIHTSDRRRLLQSHVLLNPRAIQGLYWGSERELTEIERLCLGGTFESVIGGTKGFSGSGFHRTDGKKAVDPDILMRIPHIAAPWLPPTGPALPASCVRSWPEEFTRVAGLGNFDLYEGARVIVPNGMTPEHRIRAFATDKNASVSNSCSVLRLGTADLALARFAATYLTSRLGAYLALLLAPSAVIERTQIKHGELQILPFRMPDRHSDPSRARSIVNEVAEWVASQERTELHDVGDDLPTEVEALVHEYFELSTTLRQIVTEVSNVVLPNVQPSTLDKISSSLQAAPTRAELKKYANTLVSELERGRALLGGSGSFQAQVDYWRPGSSEGMGRVVVRAIAGTAKGASVANDSTVEALLQDLSAMGLLSGVLDGGLGLRGDVLVQDGTAIHFAKPLLRRLWLTSAALDDALKIIRHVHRTQASNTETPRNPA